MHVFQRMIFHPHLVFIFSIKGAVNVEKPVDMASLLKTNIAGSAYGLSVMLNSRIEDYQYNLGTKNFFGYRVKVNLTIFFSISKDYYRWR